MRAVIYSRLSQDNGSSSVTRQQSRCEEFCHSRGWSVVGRYVDNDVSAYKPSARRPEFERLLEDIAFGAVEMVVVFKIDRLVRRPVDFERFWEEASSRGTNLASVTEPIDSSHPHGVAFIRILVALAGLESATYGLRVTALRREQAIAGQPGSTKAFGLTEGWTEIVEDEAALIREAVDRVLAGERVTAVARDWRERGISSPRGRGWADSALNRILHNPRIAGDRGFGGKVVATDCYPAIIDRATFERLQVELGQPQRRGRPKRHPHRLASGIIRCARCGASLMHSMRNSRLFYSCPHPPTGCGRLHVNADCADSWLVQQVCDHIRTGERPAAPTFETDVPQRLAEPANDYYVKRLISRDEYLTTRSHIDSLIEPPTRNIDRLINLVATSDDPQAKFASYGIETQRDMFRRYVEAVEVLATRRGTFNPTRLHIIWRTGENDPGPAD